MPYLFVVEISRRIIYVCMSNTHLLNVVDNFAGANFSNPSRAPRSFRVPVASPPPSFCSNVKCRDLGRGREPTALQLGRGGKPVFFHGFCSKLVGHWSVNRLIRYGKIWIDWVYNIWILLNIHPPEMTAPLGDHITNIEWLLVISNKWHQISIFQPSWVDYTSRSSRSIFHSLFK